MAPAWLTTVAWFYISVCFLCAGMIAYDIGFNRRRQAMGVMDAVYPITALYFGPFALALYRRWGRAAVRQTATPSRTSGAAMAKMAIAEAHGGREASRPIKPTRPRWVTMAIEVSHCGSGCTLGDLIAEWAIFALALTVAGRALFAEYIGDYVLALAFGIVFQYFAIAPMRDDRRVLQLLARERLARQPRHQDRDVKGWRLAPIGAGSKCRACSPPNGSVDGAMGPRALLARRLDLADFRRYGLGTRGRR